MGVRRSAGTMPSSSAGSKRGATGACNASAGLGAGGRVATMPRAIPSACASPSARWSATPDVRACSSPPPSSSALTTSPVAARTSGGPARKMVPCSRTITLSSHIAGT